ncbi:MAG TPA: heavy metal translocating P-type ATPase, partial [Burkholderiaceae bacterium]
MNARDLSLCFHCGTPVPPGANWSATVSGESRPMCCPGCAAVANGIVAAGMERFYLERDGFSARAPQLSSSPEELHLFDFRAGSASGTDANADASYAVEGLRCAACIWLVEHTVRALPCVRQAELNFGTGILQVSCDTGQCKPSDILGAIHAVGYLAHPADSTPYSESLKREQRALFRRLFIAGLSMMQVMMYAIPAYLANDGTMDRDMAGLMRWAGMLLTLPAVLYSAQPFFAGAWRNLRQRILGMDVPVALGIAAAFGASTAATLARREPVYFDSITMFIFLLLGSRYLELHARMRAAAALDRILRATPASARRLAHWPQDQRSELVNAETLQPGDHVLLGAGDVLAADGVIEQGATRIDLSVLTGESRPQQRTIGDALPAGACNLAHPVVLRIVRPAEASTLALVLEAARKARLEKPGLATWADSVAARFVAGLLALTLASFLYWQVTEPARAWPVLIAMLVVSCPCALSLAAPTVLAAANARLLGQGVLTIQPHVLEALRRATHVVFDKTGTLTLGKPAIRSIETVADMGGNAALALAAAVAAGDNHPLAAAIHAAGRKLTDTRTAADVECTAGGGIEATVDGMRYRLGSARFVAQLVGSASPFAECREGSEVCLGRETGWVARFQLSDALRPEARAVVEHFKAEGKSVVLLSGDRESLAQAVARELHIDRVIGNCLPEQKVDAVRALQRDGAVVAMVGDGINDAAVLSAADVSFAMGEGSALAQVSADCVLLSGRLDSLCETDRVSRQTSSLMKQNLIWAAAYNLAAIPAAAMGLIDPWMSAVGMSASSILVVLNSLRVYRKAAERRAGLTGMP